MQQKTSKLPPNSRSLTPLRAVIFDIYETLIHAERCRLAPSRPLAPLLGKPLVQELIRAGSRIPHSVAALTKLLADQVAEHHHRARLADGPALIQPEVDARQIWREVLQAPRMPLPLAARAHAQWESARFRFRAAPGALSALQALRRRGLLLGILSNAQHDTPARFQQCFGVTPEAAGFRPSLTLWSWRLGCAKPDPAAFAALTQALACRSVSPCQTLFVGNDPRSDIAPAAAAGFRTALYSGSPQPPPRTKTASSPDFRLTHFSQLITINFVKHWNWRAASGQPVPTRCRGR